MEGSRSPDPDRLISESVAISTRVAPSFIRVGQLELFARRARRREHPTAMEELEQLVLHLIDREYADVIDSQLPTTEKVLLLSRAFRGRLTSLVANWIRVGYCQGNFNSDNQAGGFTLDYGPFGFCELFNPRYQPWTVAESTSRPESAGGSRTQLPHVLHSVGPIADVESIRSGAAARDSQWLFDRDARRNGADVGGQTWPEYV